MIDEDDEHNLFCDSSESEDLAVVSRSESDGWTMPAVEDPVAYEFPVPPEPADNDCTLFSSECSDDDMVVPPLPGAFKPPPRTPDRRRTYTNRKSMATPASRRPALECPRTPGTNLFNQLSQVPSSVPRSVVRLPSRGSGPSIYLTEPYTPGALTVPSMRTSEPSVLTAGLLQGLQDEGTEPFFINLFPSQGSSLPPPSPCPQSLAGVVEALVSDAYMDAFFDGPTLQPKEEAEAARVALFTGTSPCVEQEAPKIQDVPDTKPEVAEKQKLVVPSIILPSPRDMANAEPAQKQEPIARVINTWNSSAPFPCTTRVDTHRLSGPVNDRSSLAFWGIPAPVVAVYNLLGVRKLYPWQRACLEELAVTINGENMIYSAPTSGGKTLVAEVLMVRRLLQNRGKKCLFVLPYVSIVEEKAAYLSKLCAPLGLRVRGHAGNKGGARQLLFEDIAVCTTEKANGIVNTLLENGKLDLLTILVVDEMHMVDDASRGYILEMLLTKFVYATASGSTQIIGLSATLPNAHVLAKWLHNACYFVTNFRPVPLTEYFKIGPNIHDIHKQVVRTIPNTPNDPDGLVALCNEVVQQRNSVLVFCATKRQCETVATFLSKNLIRPADSDDACTSTARARILAQLRAVPSGIDPVLEETVLHGVAYHHAGLTMEEREVVERGYRECKIVVLVCTTTLAAGVNLPARRVIFRSPMIGVEYIDIIRYKQAAGRAGRAGIDAFGESFVLAQDRDNDRQAVVKLMQPRLPTLSSCLHPQRKGMARALLEVIASRVVSSVHDIQRFICCTFFATESAYADVHQATRAALEFLERNDFIQWNKKQSCFNPSKLGTATFASALSPEEGLAVFAELQRARRSFVMDNELHLVFHLTPVFHGIEPAWDRFYQLYLRLPPAAQSVAQAIGISEAFLVHCQSAACVPNRNAPDTPQFRLHRRFFASLVLFDLIHEVSLAEVSEKFRVARGDLQKLQEMSGTFAGMVGVFCDKLCWWGFESLIQKLQDRLNHGVEQDLIELVRIPNVKAHRARALYNAGYRTALSVATANPDEIERIIAASVPYRSKARAPQTNYSPNQSDHRLARLIIKGAKYVVQQIAQELTGEMQELAQAFGGCSQANLSPSHLDIYAISQPTPVSSSVVPAKSSQPPREAEPAVQTVPPPAELRFHPPQPVPQPAAPLKLVSAPYRPTVLGKRAGSASAAGKPLKLPRPEASHATHCHNLPFNLEQIALGSDEASFMKKWQNAECFGYHFIISSANEKRYLRGVSVALNDESATFLQLGDGTTVSGQRMELVRKIMQSPTQKKSSFDSKQQIVWLRECGLHEFSAVRDPLIADWLVNPEDRPGGEDVTLDALVDKHSITRLVKLKGRAQTEIQSSAKHAIQSLALMTHLHGLLVHNQLLEPFEAVEMPLLPIIAAMESHGMGFDPLACEQETTALQRIMRQSEADAYKISGYRDWDISSPRDVSRILFDRLGLPIPETHGARPVKTGRPKRVSHPTTNSATLQKLIPLSPLPEIILRHRKAATLLQKYLLVLPQTATVHRPDNMSRIFAYFMQAASATGRLLVVRPNLQTIPRPLEINVGKTETGEAAVLAVNIRKAFAARSDCVILSADYSQIEIRLMAHFSGDTTLTEILMAGGDIFRQMASRLVAKPEAEVTVDERQRAKAICYGILYGQGKMTLAEELEVTPDEADTFLREFKAKYEGVTRFLESSVNSCRQLGYVETLFKRRRYLPAIYSHNHQERAQAERQAVNTVCQGSAADLMKIVMVRLQEAFDGLRDQSADQEWVARFLLQIHDELLFEVRTSSLPTVTQVVHKVMESSVALNVPTPVNLRAGPSWGDMQVLTC
eukprot:TRINITY_DN7226_c0_g1_i3.p1 TRINITY_DN7226_c0_g1~~TRINITY_DN7226_c0_g1_i3.p1  ORF type:complete len:1840 (+),score=235.77 TRINITY_DN7226_c0_g1_i3:85-5604(+)